MAVNVTLLPAHIVVWVAVMLTPALTIGLTVTVTLLLLAVAAVTQAALEVSWQLTTSLLLSADVVKVLLLPLCVTPLTFQVYVGELPPLVAVAVNVTPVPAQKVVVGVDMLTVGVTFGLTVTVTLLEVAVLGDAQGKFEVSAQLYTSLFAAVVVEYVEDVAPEMFVPFFFHW